jgi:hypothetical protein
MILSLCEQFSVQVADERVRTAVPQLDRPLVQHQTPRQQLPVTRDPS